MRERRKFGGSPVVSRVGWIRHLLIGLVVLIIGGFVYQDYRRTQVVGSPYRYNLVLTSEGGNVTFITFDPQEKQVYAIPFPKNLEIKSRSVGTYRIENLYKLGSYEGKPGAFVRRKVQGFMRVPVTGFLETSEAGSEVKPALRDSLRRAIWSPERSSLSRIDALILYKNLVGYEWRESNEEELVRAGVIKKEGEVWQYSHERLKQFLGVRVFDWAIGGESITVAIVNNSGIDGLGADIAEFMSNLGFDVVSVKSGVGEKQEETVITYSQQEEEEVTNETMALLQTLFNWGKYNEGETEQYRAKLLVTLGTDAVDLF